ncbi:MAG: adenylate/guanylate cyclase domain-containing protein [Pseudomonadota bacterium]|nr:adenylate/guanylate cyclase domain-containing protein [Pseudomonadota bacterium]
MKRKLTTIFYADAVRFGASMEADEAAALARLTRARTVMTDLFAAHDGRLVNTWGDAVIAEFASVVEAVRCAVAFQDAMAAQGAAGEGMDFRIGVNLGDVIDQGGDLYGDGVNVAERLQGLAAPGGIMVSATVRDLTRKQLVVEFDYAGAQNVKSLAEPVESWSIRRAAANRRDPAASGDAGSASGAALSSLPAIPEDFGPLHRWLAWYRAQPRVVRRAAGAIVFFFALNVMFGGLSSPWFLFPSIPFLAIILRTRADTPFPWRAARPGPGPLDSR